MKQAISLAWALGLALLLAACARFTPAGEQPPLPHLTQVRACTSSMSMLSTISAYARKHGLFAKHGLDVSLLAIAGGPEATVALIAGDADLCEIAGPAVVNAALAGEDLVMVAGYGNRLAHWLIVRPEIGQAADLQGKVVAVSSPGSSSDTALRIMLQALGLQPDVDVTIVAVGGNPERLAAMASGQVAGAMMSLPESARAESMGYRVLMAPNAIDMAYQPTAVVTKRAYLAQNRAAVAGYVAAVTEAIARMKADQTGAEEVMVAELAMDPVTDAAVIDVVYQQFFHDYLPDKPYLALAGVQFLIDTARQENPTARPLRAAEISDATIVEELDQSGFIDALYAR